MSKFYVYLHRRASDGRVFYVGKGCGRRAWIESGRNRHWQNVAAKHGFTVEIYRDALTEIDAHALEVELIAQYGRANLCNLTDGGEGASGVVWTDAQREAKRIFQTGKMHSEQAKRKVSIAKKGKPAPWAAMNGKASAEKTSLAKKGKPAPWAVGHLNHMHRPEMKAALSARCKGVRRHDMDGAKNPSAKPIVCVETGVVFETMKSAAEWLVSMGKVKSIKAASNICSVCSGKLKAAYGFTWEYYTKENGGR